MTKIMKMLIVALFVTGLSFAQNAANAPSTPPPMVAPADAKNHVGEMATVCGKVVDTKIPKYGLAGRGKPVSFFVDQPQTNTVFYFVAFGTEAGGAQEVVAAYQGKRVCVAGKIAMQTGAPPFILAADRSRIKIQPEGQ
ncbi:MAG: hypothetical protein WB523_04845 [Candidatus Sulfotelmatobacter sp.]